MRKIVVGVDGSSASETALKLSARLARATDSELWAIHSFRHPYAEIPPDEHERMLRERSRILDERWIRPAEQPGVRIHTELLEGDPRHLLETLDLAASHDDGWGDLLVLGRSGAGGSPGFLHVGSVTEHVAHHSPHPLLVVPAGAADTISTMVLGVDGSAESAHAVEWCADVAPRLDATVIATTVQEPVAEWTPSWDDHNWRRDAERHMTRWLEPLTRADVEVEMVINEQMHPADGLLGVATARGADLLVVGTRGTGGFAGLRFGGVAMKVLHRATMPVALVPPR